MTWGSQDGSAWTQMAKIRYINQISRNSGKTVHPMQCIIYRDFLMIHLVQLNGGFGEDQGWIRAHHTHTRKKE